ncbi:MAG: PIG-L family deacetylase [Ilumatobacter sp.]|nr:PIG-L family deacetylase [Ilumatobacter sp.]
MSATRDDTVWTIADAGEHVAAVVAHPDDESFGCGSLLAMASAIGAHVTVICATRGESGERRPDPTTDAWPLGLLREAELCQAAVVLGVDDVVILDYVDSGFAGPTPNGALVATPLTDLADDLAWRLGALEPDVVVTLDASDGHRDHRHVRDALSIAVGRLARPVRLVHSCLAQSLMREWVDVMRRTAPDRDYLALEQLGRPDDDLTAVDTSSVLAVRERAIACHLSQSSPFDDLPADLRRRFLTVDHVVEFQQVRS